MKEKGRRRHLRGVALLGLLATICIAGSARTTQAEAARADAAASVRAVDAAGLTRALASQKGKVVLVNFWATWCAPCVAEFPDLVKLSDRYRAKGLVVLAVSLDEPEDRGKVVAFIKKQHAAFPVYLRSGGAMEAFGKAIDKRFDGGVPVSYVFGKDGKLVGKPAVGLQSPQQFEALVHPLFK